MRVLLLAAAAAAAELRAPGIGCGGKGAEYVKGEYIAVLRNTVGAEAHDGIVARTGGRKMSIGRGTKAFRAVHATLGDADLQWALAHPEVVYVEHNLIMRIADAKPANLTARISCPDRQGEPLSWGQKRTTVASAADVAAVFAHDKTWGAGVDVYVADTGIRITHNEFAGGRAIWGANTAGGQNTDVHGHGTHVAGTIAGTTYGVAKGATVIAVKVLGDSGAGTNAGVIAGVEFAATNAAARKKPSIGNMSLGGGYSAALNQAVNAAASEGVLFSNAAGNCNSNACNYSPASAEDGICVGSTELASQSGRQVDSRSSFSNHGTCNDVFAPGSSITAAYATSDSAFATMSGTSMAAPHVAGVGAVVLGAHPSYSAKQVHDWITANALDGLVNNPGSGSPNKMLHVQC